MKKPVTAAVLVLAAALAAQPAFAYKQGTPEYQRMVEIKKAQRERRAAERANPEAREKGFWAREAERSGIAGTAAMVTGAVDRVVPGQQKKQSSSS